MNKELFKKYENEVDISEKGATNRLLVGINYLQGYGQLEDICSEHDILFLHLKHPKQLDEISIRHLVNLGFNYISESCIAFNL